MGLETSTYIVGLVTSNPDGNDQRSTADDHIRLIKAVLKRTFPLLDGAVSLSHTQLMRLNDVSASVQLQLNQLRDGSATANNAINARWAESASTANFIGTIPANDVARLGSANTFTAPQIVSGTNNAFYQLLRSDAGTNAKRWRLQITSPGTFGIVTENDSGIAVDTAIAITRSGASVGAVTISAPTINLSGTVNGTISNAVNASHANSASFATSAAAAVFATTARSASSAALLSGLSPAELATASTIAQRNSSGDLFVRYINQGSPNSENPSVGQVIVITGNDGYLRKSSVSHFGRYVSGQNITGRTGTQKTLSSSAPTGGSNGDIWYQY